MATESSKQDAAVLEQGNIYFLFRPKVGESDPQSIEDVQRLYMVLSPHGKKRYRLVVLGRKRLPEVHGKGERYWGFVDRVVGDAKKLREDLEEDQYSTKTRGERVVPAARPAGEGVYSLVDHDGHTHLTYALELPETPGEVQDAFNIEEEASYVVSVKNPQQPSPRGAGLGRAQKAEFPKRLQERFRGRRFANAEPELLDREGAELVLVGASDDVSEELGIELDPQHESLATAELFKDLRLRKSQHPVKPLAKGEWE